MHHHSACLSVGENIGGREGGREQSSNERGGSREEVMGWEEGMETLLDRTTC